MLDTLKASRNLLRVGFTEKQADVIVEIEKEKQDQLATKDFIDKKNAELRTEVKEEIAELRTEVKEEIAELRTELKEENSKIQKDLSKLTGEMKILSRMAYFVLSALVVGFVKLIFFP